MLVYQPVRAAHVPVVGGINYYSVFTPAQPVKLGEHPSHASSHWDTMPIIKRHGLRTTRPSRDPRPQL